MHCRSVLVLRFTTQHVKGLTMFHTVQHRGQLTMAQIRSSVPRMADLCLISIISISPRGFPSATSKLSVWYSVIKPKYQKPHTVHYTQFSIKCVIPQRVLFLCNRLTFYIRNSLYVHAHDAFFFLHNFRKIF